MVAMTLNTAPGKNRFASENTHLGFFSRERGRRLRVPSPSRRRHQGYGKVAVKTASGILVRTMPGYVTGTGNQLLSDGTHNYTYDDEGNTLTKVRISDGQRTEYSWDYRNRMTQVVVKDSGGSVLRRENYTYNVFDQRIGSLIDADGDGLGVAVRTSTVYDGDHP